MKLWPRTTKSGRAVIPLIIALTLLWLGIRQSGWGMPVVAQAAPGIQVPIFTPTPEADGRIIYIVKANDTLLGISLVTGVPVDKLRALNNLTSDTIVPGWKLLVQKTATQPSPATPSVLAIDPTVTRYPTVVPFYTPTLMVTATILPMPLGQFVRQISMVVAALLISFSVLVAGLVGFGRKKDRGE